MSVSNHQSDGHERLLRMNYVPIDSNRSLVRIRTGFFVLFSVFKKRMTLEWKRISGPGGALSPGCSCERGDSLSYRSPQEQQPNIGRNRIFFLDKQQN